MHLRPHFSCEVRGTDCIASVNRPVLNKQPRRVGHYRSFPYCVFRHAIACLIVFLIGAEPLYSKARIQVVGGTPESCKKQVDQVRQTLVELPLPDDWTFVVVCTPIVWENILRRADALGKTGTGFTNLESRYTFFNGWGFAPRVAAHEIGHIMGKTMDHNKAETIGLDLLRQQRIGSFPRRR